MAKNRRSPRRSTEAASHPSGTRYAAASRVFEDLASRDTRSSTLAFSIVRRTNRHRQVPAPVYSPKKAAPRPYKQLFGTWSTSPPPPQVQRLLKASPCVRRQTRREVIFATRSIGAGSHSPKRHYSNRRCK